MSSYYSDDEDLDIHVSRRRAASPVHYVEPRPRVRPYYQGGTTLLMPERTVIATRARSRERSRERRSSSPSIAPPPPPQPVIINNKIYNEHSSDEEDHHHRMVVRSRRRSDSRSRSRSGFMTREDYEIERTRREIEELKVIQAREREERRSQKEYRDDAELRRAKLELDDIKRREARDDDEKRIKRELELQRLREEDRIEEEKQKLKRELELERLREEEKEEEEKKRREKEAKDAVEKYKAEEMEKAAKAQREKEERDADYRRRLQEDLINSGLDEKAIQAILKKEKLPEPAKETGRPTYTRMARRHLSIETLRTFHVDYDLDPDPEYILIKRWVPEWEQDSLWKHTRYIREKRTKTVLAIEDGHHKKHHHDTGLEWVRKKERKRSKSPALLMYLAGRQS